MNNSNQIQVIQNEQQQFTRSDRARNIRATEDLRQQVEQRRQNINQQLVNSRDIDVIGLTNQRNELFAIEDQLQEISKKIMPNTSSSSAATSDVEKQEIRGLYGSGLYTQKQIASQYGISQPAISQILTQTNK